MLILKFTDLTGHSPLFKELSEDMYALVEKGSFIITEGGKEQLTQQLLHDLSSTLSVLDSVGILWCRGVILEGQCVAAKGFSGVSPVKRLISARIVFSMDAAIEHNSSDLHALMGFMNSEMSVDRGGRLYAVITAHAVAVEDGRGNPIAKPGDRLADATDRKQAQTGVVPRTVDMAGRRRMSTENRPVFWKKHAK